MRDDDEGERGEVAGHAIKADERRRAGAASRQWIAGGILAAMIYRRMNFLPDPF